MSTRIIKVALAGATGNLGPAILDQLLAAGFQVTVLTRQGSTHTFPAGVKVAHVDYESIDSLASALKGQDASISTLGTLPVATQLNLVTAAARAGIKRYIPSEFGSNLMNEKLRAMPIYADKITVQDALKKEAANNGMGYTFIFNGPFLDWGIKAGVIINLKGRSVDLFEGGERPFSTTTLASIGKAVAGVLKHPEETKNRAVYVHDTAITAKKLADMAKKATGPDGWKENVLSSDEVLKGAWAEANKENSDPHSFVMSFLKVGIWGDGCGAHYETTDNELLGLKEMTDAELQDLVTSLAK